MLRLTLAVFVALLLWTLTALAHADEVTAKPDQGATHSEPRPAVDLAFDFHDGDTVRSNPQVVALGKALSDPGLKNATFVIACHVKVPGSPVHNFELSERCASLAMTVSN